jgi:hypothetical protein
MHELKKNTGEIFQSNSCLDFHIGNFQTGITVAVSFLHPREHTKINRFHRAETEGGSAEFAPVLPDGPAFFNEYIVHWTNRSTGDA